MKREQIDEILWERRRFLQFLGRSAVTVSALGVFPSMGLVSSCAAGSRRHSDTIPFRPLAPLTRDEVTLADGFRYNIVAKWMDPINSSLSFGTHNDFLSFVPLDPASPEKSGDALLWVNHEYLHPLLVTGAKDPTVKRPTSQILEEQEQVGGSIIHIRKDLGSGDWKLVQDERYNRRITARTRIPFAWDRPIAGATSAVGTLGNCGGGQTPWRTILTCEENYQEVYGERDFSSGKPGGVITRECYYGWEKVFKYPPEHYGWVVEVNPLTGSAKKLIALGRYSHESATVAVARDGRCVVYSGDDAADRCLYKFIAEKPGSLERGTLYVADLKSGRWQSLDWKSQPVLQKHFADQTEVLIRAREAALLVGGTQLDRPEDIDIDPLTGSVYMTLTNNRAKGNFFGSILKITESGKDPTALDFESATFLAGGPQSGFACPDNLCFDSRGGLWMTSDISGSSANKPPYEKFGNNGLFYIPTQGSHAGEVFQVASAPMDAEFTGPCFAPDGKTLFLSVQHPGETSKDLSQLTSHWPEGGATKPRSAVIGISGPSLEQLIHGVRT
jgi:secreted PhoX family phosphatase